MLLLRCLHKANIDERIEKTPINESWILITFSRKETHGIINIVITPADHYLGMWVTQILSVRRIWLLHSITHSLSLSTKPYYIILKHSRFDSVMEGNYLILYILKTFRLISWVFTAVKNWIGVRDWQKSTQIWYLFDVFFSIFLKIYLRSLLIPISFVTSVPRGRLAFFFC